jgi:hypothetical protein
MAPLPLHNWTASSGFTGARIDRRPNGVFQISRFNTDRDKWGQGYGREALKEIRAKFQPTKLIAHAVDSTSIAFWSKMLREGLIDDMTDVDGWFVKPINV